MAEVLTVMKTVFLIDLPRIAPTERNIKKRTVFQEELIYFLKAKGLMKTAVDSIDNFDFSATEDMAFVHTMFVNSPSNIDLQC